ncbi:hypothetical protein [Bradyrhizobium cenepequi]
MAPQQRALKTEDEIGAVPPDKQVLIELPDGIDLSGDEPGEGHAGKGEKSEKTEKPEHTEDDGSKKLEGQLEAAWRPNEPTESAQSGRGQFPARMLQKNLNQSRAAHSCILRRPSSVDLGWRAASAYSTRPRHSLISDKWHHRGTAETIRATPTASVAVRRKSPVQCCGVHIARVYGNSREAMSVKMTRTPNRVSRRQQVR